MPSAFPGMDPYLESPAFWSDFHGQFVYSLREVIADDLPEPYLAKVNEEVVVLGPPPRADKYVPDVLVAGDRTPARHCRPSAMATLDPVTLHNVIAHEDPPVHYIEIVRSPDLDPVTIIEVLSPTNKQGERAVYARKRQRILRSEPTNLVEIDLLRGGHPVDLDRPLPTGHYHAMVSRGYDRPNCDVYSWTVRDRLPTLPVPLAAGDPDASADLARAFELAFDRGRYGRMIRYMDPPPPPRFEGSDADWVIEVANRVVR